MHFLLPCIYSARRWNGWRQRMALTFALAYTLGSGDTLYIRMRKHCIALSIMEIKSIQLTWLCYTPYTSMSQQKNPC